MDFRVLLATAVGGAGLALGAAPVTAQERCDLVLSNANVYNGDGFELRDLVISDGRFVSAASEEMQRIDASLWTILPPMADVHTHMIDQPRPFGAPGHSRYLDKGIYYVLNPNNIRFDDALPLTFEHVDGTYTGGGLTSPGGHPRPLYERLIDWGVYRMTKEDLPGRAFHEISTDEDAKVAIAEVKRQGASHVKLYLVDHEKPDSIGLSAENFRSAVRYAKAAGLYPVVHVNSRADFQLAAAEKVHAMVHMPGARPDDRTPEDVLLTEQDAQLAADNGVFVVPTLSVGFNSIFGAELEATRDIWRHNLGLLKAAGVRIAAGADQASATVVDELAVLHLTGVFDGNDLVQIATTNGAELAFPDRKVGRIEPGFEASFIMMGFDPTQGWLSWQNVLGGMREGVPIRGKSLLDACAAKE